MRWGDRMSAFNPSDSAAVVPLLTAEALRRAYRPAFEVLPLPLAVRLQAVALRFVTESASENTQALVLLMRDPYDAVALQALEHHIAEAFAVMSAADDLIELLLAEGEEAASALSAMGDAFQENDAQDDTPARVLTLENLEREPNSVIRLVDSTVLDAINLGASDIHLERTRSGLVVKYRLDGVLQKPAAPNVNARMAAQVLARVKVLADLDVTEHRVPQDGRARFQVQGRAVDVRVSILPGSFGEEAVLRILDKKNLAGLSDGVFLERLGFDAPALESIRSLSRRPYGMLLVTGPTGSGKSTTLYAALSGINTGRDKIITIEDPVEYELPGVLQIPVNERKGLTFARGLRSILRHDPDRILVGEIRDAETAQIAIQAALTGHLVFTSVHANDAFDVIGRLVHMGVEPYAFMTAINGVVAQRLVRRVCTVCQGRSASMLSCAACRGSGYRGRVALGEVLVFDDTLRTMIVERRPLAQAKAYAEERGLLGLRQKALALVQAGITTQEEADRVTVA